MCGSLKAQWSLLGAREYIWKCFYCNLSAITSLSDQNYQLRALHLVSDFNDESFKPIWKRDHHLTLSTHTK